MLWSNQWLNFRVEFDRTHNDAETGNTKLNPRYLLNSQMRTENKYLPGVYIKYLQTGKLKRWYAKAYAWDAL